MKRKESGKRWMCIKTKNKSLTDTLPYEKRVVQ